MKRIQMSKITELKNTIVRFWLSQYMKVVNLVISWNSWWFHKLTKHKDNIDERITATINFKKLFDEYFNDDYLDTRWQNNKIIKANEPLNSFLHNLGDLRVQKEPWGDFEQIMVPAVAHATPPKDDKNVVMDVYMSNPSGKKADFNPSPTVKLWLDRAEKSQKDQIEQNQKLYTPTKVAASSAKTKPTKKSKKVSKK